MSVINGSSLLSRRRWLRGARNQNIILPLTIVNPNANLAATTTQEGIETSSMQAPPTTAVSMKSPTLIGSPSPVKMLFPSISMFNLPINTPLLPVPTTPMTADNNTLALSPPPQFAVDHKRNRLVRLLKPRKRGIRKAYPSAFETFLFDDTAPGTAPAQGIRPVRLLIERLEAWYLLAKRLLHHFEVLASVETQVAKSYRKLDHAMVFPTTTHHHNNRRYYKRKKLTAIIPSRRKRKFYKDERLLQIHFAFQGGVRGVCDAWQSYHSNTTKDHSDFATFLRNEAIPTLANIKRELKWTIKSIRSDDRLSLVTLTSLKKEAAKRLKRLDRQLVFFDVHPYHGYSKQDPWLMNAAVVKQMVKVYRQENKIHETVLQLQRETLISEEQLVEEFRLLCQHIYSMRETSTLGIDRGLESIMETFNNIKMDSDWINFCQQNKDHLVSDTAAYRHPDHLQYPNHSHALLQPIFAARMERKSKILKHWHEYIYVLTPAGFLHEYRNVNHYPSRPDATIFVPHYKVSSLSTNLHHNLIFQLQPHTASRNLLKNQGCPTVLPKEWRTSKPRLGCVDRWTWTLRAKSAVDMEAWIENLTWSSERYRPSTIHHLAAKSSVFPPPPEIMVFLDAVESDEEKQQAEAEIVPEATKETTEPPAAVAEKEEEAAPAAEEPASDATTEGANETTKEEIKTETTSAETDPPAIEAAAVTEDTPPETPIETLVIE